MPTVSISIPPAPGSHYEVVIGDGVVSELGPRAADLLPRSSKRAFLVIDDGVPSSIVDAARASLDSTGWHVTAASIHPTEANKTLDTVSRLLHQLASTRHERYDPVIALGGGIVGDISGFVASSYRRGVPVIQCPTTLLSMVDASVGGKTGVNIAARGGDGQRSSGSGSAITIRKNMVGAFWQPTLVLADTSALDSLTERHLRAGLAECVKHGLISRASDPDLFQWTTRNLLKIRMGDRQLQSTLIERNVRVKASVVEGDEREEKPSAEGGRALLNLGHTFGHAIETLPHLSPDGMPENAPLLHGEAVALGLVAASETAKALGMLSAHDAEEVRVAIERLGMPSRIVGLPDDDAIIHAMSHDKKVLGGQLRLVLPVSLGESIVVDSPRQDAVVQGICALRA